MYWYDEGSIFALHEAITTSMNFSLSGFPDFSQRVFCADINLCGTFAHAMRMLQDKHSVRLYNKRLTYLA
jgi:hypothetical protein